MKKTMCILALALLATIMLSAPCSADSRRSEDIGSVSLYTYPDKTVYGAFEEFDPQGMTLRVVYSDGSVDIIDGSEAAVRYNSGSCFRVGDSSVTLIYGGRSINIPITVNRIAYDLDALSLSSFTTVYNGKYQTYTQTVGQIVGLDGIPLRVSAVGGGINAGSYDISIDFSGDSSDYLIPESRVITMTVTPAPADLIWGECVFTYDGKSKVPVAYYIDVNGAYVYPAVTGAATNAGAGYTARAEVSDPNYQFGNTVSGFEIRRADYDFSGVVWSCDSFVYDGNKKSISASGLPSGVSVVGYVGDRGTNAGRYTVTAMLSFDEQNYNAPPTLSHSWEIKKADYDMKGVEFKAGSFEFDGKIHYPTMVGSMPIGADGIALKYSYSAGATHVDDGVVSVVISFSTDSPNYNIPNERHSSVSVTPRDIEVEWGKLELSYNGNIQAPEAYSAECSVSVSGSGLTVGKYIATATTDNTDYRITNSTAEYSIVKAANGWLIPPSSSTCYEGRGIKINGTPIFGDLSYTFYSDPEGKHEIAPPTAFGRYYVSLSVQDSDNYGQLSSEIIGFDIVEVVAVSFLANLINTDLRAFDRLDPSDVICSVLYNDGSVEVINSALVEVIYENGDSFRKKDSGVTLKYGRFVLSLRVSVGYADYDLSSVGWRDTEQIYDGQAKYPIPTGLPSGVRLIGYTVNQMIDAGSYTVGARLSYDYENYNEPIIPTCSFVIKKQELDTPVIYLTYNGYGQIPRSDSPLYTLDDGQGFVHAGVYSVTARLTDSKNYIFRSGMGDSVSARVEVLPAVIGIKVTDTELRLFEDPTTAEYSITYGGPFGNDYIGVSVYTEGGFVYLRSDNPDYTFSVDPGKIIRLPYPTPQGAFIMLLIAMIVGLLSIGGVYVYNNRERLATAAAIMRCRWHNRGFKAAPPKTPDLYAEADERDRDSDGQIEDEVDEEYENESDDLLDMEIDVDKADSLITDSLAKSLIKREGDIIYTDGSARAVIDVESISSAFAPGQRVDINLLKQRGLVPDDSAYLKVIGLGSIDRALSVYANDFTLSAVKMIALAGGSAIKVSTLKQKSTEEKE